jgi:hypothetical protein
MTETELPKLTELSLHKDLLPTGDDQNQHGLVATTETELPKLT